MKVSLDIFSAVLYPEPQCGANAALAANSHLDWQKPCVEEESKLLTTKRSSIHMAIFD